MIRTCKICEKEFDGYMSSLYCSPECKEKSHKINREKAKERNREERQFKPREFGESLPKNNSSGYRGVYFDEAKQKWRAQLRFNKKCYKLGLHDDKIDAIRARQKAELEYYGKILDDDQQVIDYNEIIKYIKDLSDTDLIKMCNSIYDYVNNDFVLLYKQFEENISGIDELVDLFSQESKDRFYKLNMINKMINNKTE